METNNEKKSITMHQGIGEDAMEIKVQVTQEEFEKMEQLRGLGPEKWEGKDLELLQEARILIKQQKEINEVQQSSTDKVIKSVVAEEEKKKGNPGLWWAIGILAVLVITMKIIAGTLEKRNRETFQQVFKNNPELMNEMLNTNAVEPSKQPQYHVNSNNFLHKLNLYFCDEIMFQYPSDWSFEDQTNGHRAREYYGSNKQESQIITYSWVVGPINTTANQLLENTSNHYKSEFGYIRFFGVKEIKYNTYNAVSKDFEFTEEGETVFGQIICIVNEDSACTIMKMADSKRNLESDDFKLMESTFIMPLLPIKTIE